MKFQCLLFDLDGTLVDSSLDIIKSVNLMLTDLNRRNLDPKEIIDFVGEGARLLVERALRSSGNNDNYDVDQALKLLFHHYNDHLFDETRPYPEVINTLNNFSELPMAVVTNKPYQLTEKLLEGLGMTKYFKVVFGGDSLPTRKPDPLMLLEAARLCNVEPTHCLMVGDTKFDILAGIAAGTKTCGFTGGFRAKDELIEAGADYLITNFAELKTL